MKNTIITATLIVSSFVGGTLVSTDEKIIDTDVKDTQVCVDIKAVSKFGTNFSDRICYSPEEYSKLTSEEIENQKQTRLTNWENLVETQSAHVPTKQEIQDDILLTEQRLSELQELYANTP